MTTNTRPVYPDASARRLLRDHVGMGATYRAARVAAGKDLITQLSSLLGEYKVMTDALQQSTGVVVFMPDTQGTRVTVGVSAEHGTMIVNVDGNVAPVPLLFNTDTGLFEGKEVEEEVTPVPGQLRERRSALATILAIIFRKSPKV